MGDVIIFHDSRSFAGYYQKYAKLLKSLLFVVKPFNGKSLGALFLMIKGIC